MDKDTITYLIALIGCSIGIYSWYKSNKKDTQEYTTNFTKVNLKLDDQCGKLDRIYTSLEKLNDTVNAIQSKQLEHDFRIKALEEEMKEMRNK